MSAKMKDICIKVKNICEPRLIFVRVPLAMWQISPMQKISAHIPFKQRGHPCAQVYIANNGNLTSIGGGKGGVLTDIGEGADNWEQSGAHFLAGA